MAQLAVGVIGAARGLSLAQIFDALPETRVVAIADRIEARLKAALAELPGAEGFSDADDLLRRAPDVVVVASSPPQHAAHVRAALEAGAAVLSEVPAADTLDGAQRIVDAVTRTGGFYMLGENCNYYGFILAWKQLLRTGVLGEIVHAEGEYVHDIRSITHMDSAGRTMTLEEARRTPDARPTWRAGYHPILYITHSLGPLLWLIEDRCTSASCLASGTRTAPEVGSPDAEVATFSTTRGVPIRQLCAFSVPREPGGQWYSLYTTTGCVEWRRCGWDSGRMYLAGKGMTDFERMPWTVAPPDVGLPDSGHGGIDGALVKDFVRALVTGAPSPIDVHAAMDTSLPGIFARMSAERGGERLRIPDTRTERLA